MGGQVGEVSRGEWSQTQLDSSKKLTLLIEVWVCRVCCSFGSAISSRIREKPHAPICLNPRSQIHSLLLLRCLFRAEGMDQTRHMFVDLPRTPAVRCAQRLAFKSHFVDQSVARE